MAPAPSAAARAARLVGLTLGYNVVEAVVALMAGVRSDSVALLGFGLDSVIESTASAILLWRLAQERGGATPALVERAEATARRLVGWTFVALAAYVGTESVVALAAREAAGVSAVGIVLAAVSLVVMPVLAWRKACLARVLQSAALAAEAKETLACAYLSLCLLAGLGLHAAVGLWWADPAAALLMVPWLLREGVEGVRGD